MGSSLSTGYKRKHCDNVMLEDVSIYQLIKIKLDFEYWFYNLYYKVNKTNIYNDNE